MPQSLSSVSLHLVFSTYQRTPFLVDGELRERAHQYLGGISARLGCKPVIVGGAEDHVHLLVDLDRKVPISGWVQELKRSSTLWMKRQGLPKFSWQSGYGVFSVSNHELPDVQRYIENQEQHHRTWTFKDERRSLLLENGIEFDERFVWD